MTVKLGVNIDHIATLRQARGGNAPDPFAAAEACLALGARYIVLHIRRDRRHVQESDLERLTKKYRPHIHLEMANTKEMVDMALKYKPGSVCFVPEYPNELTTSGGLKLDDKNIALLRSAAARLKKSDIEVSLFINPTANDVRRAKKAGAAIVELCTKDYSEAKTERQRLKLLEDISMSSILAKEIGLSVHSGHGLTTDNVGAVAAVNGMECLNIGFSIIARAVISGLPQAVLEMKQAINAR
ncbi:MAG: pyridoxine 5'-phosphate synthase [Elusimicrobiota bacterium]|jgi:pyridoxine 5-phosphate synthase|nr:pyridoxine 5'-phosphate synthase [Elusimicrobiota bacterium]MDR0734657.1 pyridoxine 5'-phosphate synthase [Elusimicrobiota bacterium]